MVGGDLELRGFHGNMSISKHSADLETTRFPWKPRDFQKKYASSRAGLRFLIEFTPARTRGNCSFFVETTWFPWKSRDYQTHFRGWLRS